MSTSGIHALVPASGIAAASFGRYGIGHDGGVGGRQRNLFRPGALAARREEGDALSDQRTVGIWPGRSDNAGAVAAGDGGEGERNGAAILPARIFQSIGLTLTA